MKATKPRLFVLTEGTRISPASRIRAYELLDRLRSEGNLEYRAVSYTSNSYCRALVGGSRPGFIRLLVEQVWHVLALVTALSGTVTAGAVLIQRVLMPVWLQRLFRLLNSRVIYDFDDAVYRYKPSSARRFACQVRTAAAVTAVSELAAAEAVARGADSSRVHVLYTPVDCKNFSLKSSYTPESFTVGWIGTPSTAGYLQGIWPELAGFAAENRQVRFVFIGCKEFDTGELSGRVRFVPWSPQAEVEELPRLDVGVMPLEDSEWERGKGGFKLIQYMAAGVATVSSPVGANLEIVVDGQTGLFADGPGDWKVKLGELLADRERCQVLGRAGRERAEGLYDYRITMEKATSLLQELGS